MRNVGMPYLIGAGAVGAAQRITSRSRSRMAAKSGGWLAMSRSTLDTLSRRFVNSRATRGWLRSEIIPQGSHVDVPVTQPDDVFDRGDRAGDGGVIGNLAHE